MARVGRLTSLPCRPLGPVSSISRRSMRRAKSQAAMPVIAGASILPLKQRCAGRSLASSAPIRIGRGGLERQRCRCRDAGLALVVDCIGALQGLLADAQHAGRRVGARPDAIPDARAQGLADDDPRAADLQRHAFGREHQRKARAGLRIAARDHGLRSIGRQGRPDQRLDRQRLRQLEGARGLDQAIGARPGMLQARGMDAVEHVGEIVEFLRRTIGVRIAAHDPDQRGTERAWPGARDLEGDLFARRTEKRSA